MAVAPDTYDVIENELRGGIHPRNKQTPSLRLAIAGFNVAYGFTNYPTRGPWPMNVKISGKYFITKGWSLKFVLFNCFIHAFFKLNHSLKFKFSLKTF